MTPPPQSEGLADCGSGHKQYLSPLPVAQNSWLASWGQVYRYLLKPGAGPHLAASLLPNVVLGGLSVGLDFCCCGVVALSRGTWVSGVPRLPRLPRLRDGKMLRSVKRHLAIGQPSFRPNRVSTEACDLMSEVPVRPTAPPLIFSVASRGQNISSPLTGLSSTLVGIQNSKPQGEGKKSTSFWHS